MPDATLPALICVVAVSLVSLSGAALLVLGGRTIQALIPVLVSLSAGALMGGAILHLLPHAVEEAGGFTPSIAWGVLGGLVGFFLIEQVIHWHHHGEDVHEHSREGLRPFGWMNLLGDAIHNFLDGLLIGGAWLVSEEAGLATAIAVALHEIPQEFGDFGVLIHAGMKPARALRWNLLSGLVAVLGALLVLVGSASLHIEGFLAPVAAGAFLYVACADLVPEIRARARGRGLLATSAALAAGLAMVAAIAHEH